jgi:hypothetical protein
MRKLFGVTFAYLVFCGLAMWLMTHFGMKGDYLASAATAAVGYLAYVVYELGKISQSEDAAKIVILEIRQAESALLSLRAEQTTSNWTKVVMGENNWARYRQLFVSVLNSDEFQHFDRFFHNWSQLVLWKTQVEAFGREQLLAKASKVQEMLLALDDDADFEMKRRWIITRADAESWMFEPNLLNGRLALFLTSLEPITGTAGFAKLRKYARLPE